MDKPSPASVHLQFVRTGRRRMMHAFDWTWWPEMSAAVRRELALQPGAAGTGFSALADANALFQVSRLLTPPNTWNVSQEGVLSFEWDRGECSGFMVVFSGDLEAACSIRQEKLFSSIQEFRMDEGLPQEARYWFSAFTGVSSGKSLPRAAAEKTEA